MVMRVPTLRRRMCATWPSLLACVGCASYPALADPLVVPDPGPPAITALELSCDNEAGRWRLEVGTDAWTSGGELIWTVDGSYVERFGGLRSVQAQADGTGTPFVSTSTLSRTGARRATADPPPSFAARM